jgi:hypothetical protein
MLVQSLLQLYLLMWISIISCCENVVAVDSDDYDDSIEATATTRPDGTTRHFLVNGLRLDGINASTDPYELAVQYCSERPPNCMHLVVNYIERVQARRLNLTLPGWSYDEHCKCYRPPRLEKLSYLQFMHIPKTGTSINWALHGYFDCELSTRTDPCSQHLRNVNSIDRLVFVCF